MERVLTGERLVSTPATIEEIGEKLIVGEGRRIILLDGHPDDQLFFGGAVLDMALSQGEHLPDDFSVTDVTLTLGENGQDFRKPGNPSGESLADARWRENVAGLQAIFAPLGDEALEVVTGTHFPDGSLEEHENDIYDWLNEHHAFRHDAPAIIVTMNENGGDGHPDHMVAYRVARHLALERGWPMLVFGLAGSDSAQTHALSDIAIERMQAFAKEQQSQWPDGPPGEHAELLERNFYQLLLPID